MSSARKRKNRPGKAQFVQDDVDTSLDPALFIQAYEADIIRGPQAKQAADSLDFIQHLSNRGDRTRPSALIQWNPPDLYAAAAFPSDADDDFTFSSTPDKSVNNTVWVDRYDARLLLDALPKSTHPLPPLSPPSPTGWSDLPSDSEDTFFFSPDEADDYRREKRRKLMDHTREERLKARRVEDGVPEEEGEDVWGGSDEEPDEAQTILMERTAASVISGRNPAQLEMRILANYGSDKRFAFLRGRWKAAWAAMKRKALEKEREEASKQSAPAPASGLGNLADYGDSDEEEEEEEADAEAAPDPAPRPQTALAARQARAKAWAESRRAAKSNASS
ncbi:hypothetical protein DFH08DRAFT_1089805 [Mycena albidolilacea]|uniref:Uncharacterized protein n=1 Tax=Mycena albidolilacea TaxID=1033008 RepID=A0AAD6YZQ1_9AGAR|nr:hypothetical protein DFH08DRAFT_1089805 [Mycena albidolilacea]